MADTKAKYHHLIPRTYLSAWEHGNGTLYVRLLDNKEKIVERNKDKIAGITNYHSIVAGMPIVTKADADIIFACLADFEVHYKGVIISDSLELNRIYDDFKNWTVYRKDHSVVSQKKLRSEIEKVKIRDIETLWSAKYEDEWGRIRSKLVKSIMTATEGVIPNTYKEYLMKFYTALDWRSIKSNIQFNDAWEKYCKEVLHLDEIYT